MPLLASLLASLLAGPPALPSEPPPLLIEWVVPETCPRHDEVEQQLRGLAGADAGLQVWATIEQREAEHVVALRFRDHLGESERSFAARDCELLTKAVVLVVAVALDPVAVGEQLDAPSPPDPPIADSPIVDPPITDPPITDPPLTDPPEPQPQLDAGARELDGASVHVGLPSEPEPAPRLRLRIAMRAFGSGSYGPTRTGYGGIGGSLGLLGERWRVDLGGLWTIPRDVRLDPSIGGRFDAWAITLRACFVPTLRRSLELPLCPGVEAGQVRARGLDTLAVAHRVALPWVAPSLSQGLWWTPLERLALGLELALLVPLTRGSFVVETFEVDRLAPVGVRGLAGIELRLP